MKYICMLLISVFANGLLANNASLSELKEIINSKCYKKYQNYINNHDITPIINNTDEEGMSLLFMALAAKNSDYRIIKDLLKKGANPNQECPKNICRMQYRQNIFYERWTSAHVAVSLNKEAKILNILLDHQADFFKMDNLDFSPAILAFRYIRTDIIKWMQEKELNIKSIEDKKDKIIKSKDKRTEILYLNYFTKNIVSLDI